uniref:non-specific serine/threonine protein kinase n=2 Tax=Oryza TaxID=4527 RepID=A0A0E0NC64_ORYRU
MPWAESLLFLLLLFSLPIPFSHSWSFDYPSPIANINSLWTNNNATIPYSATYPDGSTIRAILVRQNPTWYSPFFACGFICTAPCNDFLFAIFSVSVGDPSNPAFNTSSMPRIMWTANRSRPVKDNASLQFKDGNLILRDFDGSLVWSTNTSDSRVVGLNLAETGNMVLFDAMGKTVWESFEHPTDTLLLGQSLRQGKRLTSDSLATNWTQVARVGILGMKINFSANWTTGNLTWAAP